MALLAEPTPQIDPALIAGLGGPPGGMAGQPGQGMPPGAV